MQSRTLIHCFPLALTLCAAFAPAQDHFVAYPQNRVQNDIGVVGYVVGQGGFTDAVDRSRMQMVVPREYLPTAPTVITGIEFAVDSGGAQITFDSLQVILSERFTSGPLDPTFANNYGSTPVVAFDVALSATPNVVNWTGGWNRLAFATPFVYTAMGDLVVEVQKDVDETQPPFVGNSARQVGTYTGDFGAGESMIYSSGDNASTANTDPVAGSSFPVHPRVRLVTPTATLSLTSNYSVVDEFEIGTSYDLVFQGVANTLTGYAAATGFTAGPPLVAPGIAGAVWLDPASAVIVGTAVIGASGEATATLNIPSIAGLVGLTVVWQGVHFTGASLEFTNAASFEIQ